MAEVTLTGVSKSFGDDIALEKLTMTVPDGSFVVLLGPARPRHYAWCQVSINQTAAPSASAGVIWTV